MTVYIVREAVVGDVGMQLGSLEFDSRRVTMRGRNVALQDCSISFLSMTTISIYSD